MREWLAKLTPAPWLSKKLLMVAVLVGVGIGAYCWGRHYATANPPPDEVAGTPGATLKNHNIRIVGYVYNQPIYREELGEYLIARFGAERLDFMINRKIVEAECRKQGVVVSDSDVESRFIRDVASFGKNITVADFEQNVLRRFNKTVYEWKEDVIRPKLQMEKLVASIVKVTNKDVQQGFEARYGPKVECRMIVYDRDSRTVADQAWRQISKGRQEFLAAAHTQALPALASVDGKVPPIHKHFGDKNIEDAAFQLKEGEISGLIHMQDGSVVVLMCEKHLPATINVKFESEYTKIQKEMEELRIAQRIPEEFKKLREAANPKSLLQQESSAVNFTASQPMPQLKSPAGVTPLRPSQPPGPPPGLERPSVFNNGPK